MNACSFQVNGVDRHLHQLTEQTKISPNMKEPRLRVVSYYRWGKKAGKTNPHVRDWRKAKRGELPSPRVFSEYRASTRVFCRLSLPPLTKITRDYLQFRKDHCLANWTQRMGRGGFAPWKYIVSCLRTSGSKRLTATKCEYHCMCETPKWKENKPEELKPPVSWWARWCKL